MTPLFPAALRRLCAPLLLWLLLAPAAGAQPGAVTKMSWDSKYDYNRFILEVTSDITFNYVDAIKDKGYFYVDVYGLGTNYKKKLYNVDDATLKYVVAESHTDHGVLRLIFYTKSNSSTFNVTKASGPTRLVIDSVRDGSKANFVRAAPAAASPATPAPGAPAPGAGPVLPETAQAAPAPTPATTTVASAPEAMTPNPYASDANPDPTRVEQQYLPRIPEPRATRTGGFTRSASSGKKKLVIIDPGHGGENRGAIAKDKLHNKLYTEKELTLQFAKELKKVIDDSPNMVALLTRTGDDTVTLQDRVRFAENNQGDIFISIHLNDGAGNRDARGVEVFFLNEQGKVTGALKALEERENKDVGTSKLPSRSQQPMVKAILRELQEDKLEDWKYESYLFCRTLMMSLTSHEFYRFQNRGIKSANFRVLKNFYMPAVLLEVGFITNKDDLQLVTERRFQRETAVLLYNAIANYFAENDPEFTPRTLRLSSVRR